MNIKWVPAQLIQESQVQYKTLYMKVKAAEKCVPQW